MDLSHYMFAFFVFLLIGLLIWFYSKTVGKKDKEEKSSYEKEQRLFHLYQNIEDMLGGFEEYAEEAKKEISAGLEQVKVLLDETKKAPSGTDNKIKTNEKPVKKREKKAPVPKTGQEPEDRIPELMKKGMDKNEIAKELGISIREVSLMMDVKKIALPSKKS